MSGHAAVAVAIATMIAPYLGRRARWVAVAVAMGVCLSRMYVGAHLPLDVVGGAALGWAAGSLVHLLLGAPGGRPSPERAAKALAEQGLQVTEVVPLGGRDARRSARFRAVGPDGQRLFAKLIPRERRDEDLLYRVWRMLFRRRAEPGRPGSGPPPQQVEHEAYLGLLAGAAGVRTPRVVLAGPYGNGSGLLVSLAASFGPDRALAGAVEAFGRDPLAAALAAVAPGALTHMPREELGDAPGLWDELARRVASPAAEPAPDGDAQVRRRSSDPSR